MRCTIARLVALIVVVTLTACGGTAPTQEFGKEDVQQINKLVQDFTTAYNAKDIEKIATFFSVTATVMPPNRNNLSGTETVKSFFNDRLNLEGASELKIETQAVEGHGTLAYFAGSHTLMLKPQGQEPRHDRGKVIWILKKFAGQWKFDRQMISSDLPPAPPAAEPAAKK